MEQEQRSRLSAHMCAEAILEHCERCALFPAGFYKEPSYLPCAALGGHCLGIVCKKQVSLSDRKTLRLVSGRSRLAMRYDGWLEPWCNELCALLLFLVLCDAVGVMQNTSDKHAAVR